MLHVRRSGEHPAVHATIRPRGCHWVPVPVLAAWRRYLAAIRACPAELYEETEDEAWHELVEELAAIGRAPLQSLGGAPPR
jgi:hypothetical protein